MQCIGAFSNINTIIVSKTPCEDAIAGIDGDDRRSSVSQQAVCKTADIAAEIGTGHSMDIKVKRVDGMGQLRSRA